MNLIIKQKMKITTLSLMLFATGLFSCTKETDMPEIQVPPVIPPVTVNYTISVPCEGNSWVVDNPTATGVMVVAGGIKNWTNSNNKIRTYFYAKKTGTIEVGIRAKFDGATKLKITLGEKTQEVAFAKETAFAKYPIGKFTVNQIGYHFVELEGITKSGSSFGDISEILLGESTWNSSISYVSDDWFYWGRRGPSVHLKYEVPANKNITWFYNEITVPTGNDVIGSYYMANGFSGGYFGMQVNSETERRILFSVWSAFDTQDPNQIPAEYTVKPLGSGTGVTVGEFGGEGSGAQSYFVFNWKPATTYKFLLKGESNVNNTTDYTAYFYAPEIGEWQLISSFRRPFPSNSHLTDLYSFLENFNTSTGDKSRQVDFGNQWIYDTNGTWTELTSAKFTTDATGNAGARLDYDGGLNGNNFYLRNCGFFSDKETPNTSFTRPIKGSAPNIDFSKLEVPNIPAATSVVPLDKTEWSILEFSTQEDKGGEGTTGRAADILDGDLETYWHSCWNGCTASPPHHIIINMGQPQTVDGFKFSQRSTLSRAVKDIEIQVSADNTTWESLGNYALQNVTSEQNINLSEAKTFRYFKLIVKTAHDATDNAAMAEISAYTIE